MNARIKELAEQARDWGYAEHSGYTAQLLFEEKFAELIVKECADIAAKNQAENIIGILLRLSKNISELKNEKRLDTAKQSDMFDEFLEDTSDSRTLYTCTGVYDYDELEWEAFQYGWNAAKKHFGVEE